MKNRLEALARKRGNRKWFCAFLTLGYPSVPVTRKLVREFEEAGVDILELGFPFSDPMADGPTIQFSSEQALHKGVKLDDAFETVRQLRDKGLKIPVLFFTYFNPVFHYGMDRFLKKIAASGFDGVIIPDLPPDLEPGFHAAVRREGLCEVFLITPTSSAKRTRWIAGRSRGFIYYVSLKGVTGARKSIPGDIRRHVETIRRADSKPVLIGFGVSSPSQARELSRFSDGVIVGSAIIDALRRSGGRPSAAVKLVRAMIHALKDSSRARNARA